MRRSGWRCRGFGPVLSPSDSDPGRLADGTLWQQSIRASFRALVQAVRTAPEAAVFMLRCSSTTSARQCGRSVFLLTQDLPRAPWPSSYQRRGDGPRSRSPPGTGEGRIFFAHVQCVRRAAGRLQSNVRGQSDESSTCFKLACRRQLRAALGWARLWMRNWTECIPNAEFEHSGQHQRRVCRLIRCTPPRV